MDTFGNLANPGKQQRDFFNLIFWYKNESVTETKCRMYDEKKTKSIMNLIPDKSSLLEHLKLANLHMEAMYRTKHHNPSSCWKRLEGTKRSSNTCVVFDIKIATMSV